MYIGVIHSRSCSAVLTFLRRYASQLESFFLIEYPVRSGLPHDSWDAFTALQLLGMPYEALTDRQWSGWATMPPRGHPLRYLACSYCVSDTTIDSIRSNWTYHEEVAFVMEKGIPGKYYLVEDFKKEGWKTRMTQINGLFPWLSLPPLTCK